MTYTAEELKAFEGDYFMLESLKELLSEDQYDICIETGTYKGSTTKVLSKLFPEVISTEIKPEFVKEAYNNLLGCGNVTIYQGDSPEVLAKLLPELRDKKILFFLDSHWYHKVPLIPELRVISNNGIKPTIMIHDFFVPNKSFLDDPTGKKRGGFGFDIYHDQAYTWDWVQPHVNAIYGEGNYTKWFNDRVAPESARRGCLFLKPKK